MTVLSAATTPALFEATAAVLPDRPAVAMDTTTLTYAELNGEANRLARRLVAHGIGPERLVALAMPRSIEFVIAVLAVHKAGAAYVPVDPDYPEERKRQMLDDTSAHCLLSLPGQDVTGAPVVLSVEREPGRAEPNLADEDRNGPLRPDHPAYVIYTSGSTGRPKGVLVTHRGIPNLADDYVRRQELGPESRLLAFASPSFDAAVAEFWPIWQAGGCLVLASAPDLVPGEPLGRLVRDQRITHVTLPPSALAPLEEAGGLPAGLTLLVAGEACPAPVAKRWAVDRVMINAYGPTETTVAVTASEPLTGEETPPIGRPITGVRTYVLDDRLKPVEDGDVGELYTVGPGLARGYLRRAAATAERFLPDPFGGPGGRMYRTGDRVRARSDGQYVFVGRVDDQLKVRGHRIEPGEVEAALLAVDGVAQAVVTEHENRLVAYVVGTGGTRVPADRLLPPLREQLPGYLVPDVVVGLPSLPVSPNGKIDRVALPTPEEEHAGRAAGREPLTPTEIILAELFAEVLGVSSVGVEDSFFEIGGHSLLATRLVSRIRERLKIRLRVQAFFDAPTVARLAKVLDGAHP
ncbi:non-ribosomal peptide synthetase [Amycolatopsis sp. WAC 01375]|uniref:amino acid adenylation domain-containing protein n=1 Tax=unclassified Amycolatopsis TaxID=2618356 RepID=UPI0003846347|nr:MULTISPECIES: amino acid adenylation domain-containing protein [unclassified Amycolatopsis]AGE12650.1 BpsD [Amycolatopsis sp. WAC 01375]QKN67397.1 amino acid adenylation domain-containing protein [Streptomyces coelicolor]RSM78026.1 non-ribosomal peptide synthetase [Amycolatopsis sp. WAC 01375]RSN28352.1 non-ribosomal peptide synthetase [Amycolatopsis sp. WAC 01416]